MYFVDLRGQYKALVISTSTTNSIDCIALGHHHSGNDGPDAIHRFALPADEPTNGPHMAPKNQWKLALLQSNRNARVVIIPCASGMVVISA